MPCEFPGCVELTKDAIPGFLWKDGRLKMIWGNRMCMECMDKLRTLLQEYIPAPGKSGLSGLPMNYIVSRFDYTKKAKHDDAIRLAICFGNWVGAVNILLDAVPQKIHVESLVPANATHRIYKKMVRMHFKHSRKDRQDKAPEKCDGPWTTQCDKKTKKPLKMCKLCGQYFTQNYDGSLRSHRCVQ